MDDIPVTIHIRRVIFENFNDLDIRFNNDQIFEILKQDKNIDLSLTIDDMEIYFKEFCNAELLRNIAQNFTTQWFKLFELFEKIQCKSCKNENYLAPSEKMTCQNQICGATL